MLTNLNIQGLAIIESLAIDFSAGFNVITGETGAGKSILIKALNLLLGAKTTSDAIRKGFDSALITASFDVAATHPVVNIMTELGIPFEKNSNTVSCMIRRKISANLKSQGWINDVPVTLASLKEVGVCLVDIFAQNENHRLLNANNHTEYLDKFLSDYKVKDKVNDLYDECYGCLKRITTLVETYRITLKDQDYFSFRLEELNSFNPSTEDHSKIVETCQKVEAQHAIQETLSRVQSILDEGADGQPVSKYFREISKLLSSIKTLDKSFEDISVEASTIASNIDDLSYSLNRTHLSSDSEERLETLQDRLGEYQSFFRKFAVASVEELLTEKTRVEEFLNSIDTQRSDIETLVDHLLLKVKELKTEALCLSKLRKTATGVLKKAVETELHELAMPHAKFDCEVILVSCSRPSVELSILSEEYQKKLAEIFDILSEVGANGMEKICFMLAANKGESLLQLHKTASGGEISRIMLALKRAISSGAETCVLIFDEIDTGISGKVADVVGRKLKDLANNFQVFCISHLPQVAVYADTHFMVRKTENTSRTETNIFKLSEDDRSKEIARLLSGETITEPSLQNAKNLINQAREM